MDMKALKDAIKMRKGQGVDIKLIIGGGEEMEDEMEEKESDLAPTVKDDGMSQEDGEELMAAEMPEEEGDEAIAMKDGMDEKEVAMAQMKKAQDGYGGGSLLKKAMAMMGKK
jgi:hypothetical protein